MIDKILEGLNLQGIESWNEHQPQSARTLIREYQHLFALTLNELGKTLWFNMATNWMTEHPLKKDIEEYPLINMKRLGNIYRKC